MSAQDVGVVIVAAGTGSRVGGAELKQFRWVAGKPMLLHSVQLFQARPDVGMVVCVLPRSVIGDPPPWLFQSDTERLLLSVGGATRQDSVSNGLEDLPSDLSVIVVHDAARPLVPDAVVTRVITEARTGRSAIAALPVVDTLKEVDAEDASGAPCPASGCGVRKRPRPFRGISCCAHTPRRGPWD